VEDLPNLSARYDQAVIALHEAGDEMTRLEANAANESAETLNAAVAAYEKAQDEVGRIDKKLREAEARRRARARYVPLADGSMRISEPDLYVQGGRSFFADLYQAQLREDIGARSRIEAHQRFELEQRAVTSTSLGGLIPPAYLLDLYAKASRNGRVFCDTVNGQSLPDVGMSLIVPRLTVGTAAGVQATENTAVSTQDPTEVDLTVPVRTIAGYSPVSRQSLERAAYSDQILFEDLIARYWATLDQQCLNGTGSAGQILGVLQTAGISTSAASTATVVGVYPKILDLVQQIANAVGGIGYNADAVVMHARRWAFFCAALDTANRPLVEPQAGQGVAFNAIAVSTGKGYGGPVGTLAGLPVFLDNNIPTNLGAGTNEDRIIVVASQASHLWERSNDPVTVSFEQQAGTSLQVQLVVYGYAAFTAGRYPAASGVISGAGLVPPTF
jgi:HK97 family phage major capsid protein